VLFLAPIILVKDKLCSFLVSLERTILFACEVLGLQQVTEYTHPITNDENS
jgi:hypothetical protein